MLYKARQKIIYKTLTGPKNAQFWASKPGVRGTAPRP